jgi:hypothetical protein
MLLLRDEAEHSGSFYLVGVLPIAFVLIGQNLFELQGLFGRNRVIGDSCVVTY